MPAEAYAQEYRVKKKINELKQMRLFCKCGNMEKTTQWTCEKQNKEAGFLCQNLGMPGTGSLKRSKADPLCACDSGQGPTATGTMGSPRTHGGEVHASSGPREQGPHRNLIVDHETLWSLREPHSSPILDLGCIPRLGKASRSSPTPGAHV